MAEFDFKTATPDTTFPSGAFLFGADSQSASTPSIYSSDAYLDYILGLANTWTANGDLSAPAVAFTGTWITGGTGTTTKPLFLIEPAGTTSTGWSTSGTGLGVNAASGFTGNLIDLQVAAASRMALNGAGTALTFGASALSLVSSTNTILDFNVTNSGATSIKSPTNTRLHIYGGSQHYEFGEDAVVGLLFPGTVYIGWNGGTTRILAESNHVMAQRNGTNAQFWNLYATYASSTDYHRLQAGTAKTTLASVSGATVTATALIPDGAFLIGVTTKVTVAISGGGGTTGYQVGDGSDADRWGEATTITAGTSTDNTNATANPTGAFTAAQNVVITAVGGNFDGTGDIMVCAFYLIAQAD